MAEESKLQECPLCKAEGKMCEKHKELLILNSRGQSVFVKAFCKDLIDGYNKSQNIINGKSQ